MEEPRASKRWLLKAPNVRSQPGTVDPLVSNFRFNSDLTGTTTLTPGTYVIGGLGLFNDRVVGELSPGHNGTFSIANGITLHTHSRIQSQ